MEDGDDLGLEVLDLRLLCPLNLLTHLVGLHLDNDLLAGLFPDFTCSQGLVVPLGVLLLASLDASWISHLLLNLGVVEHDVVVFELEAHLVEHLYRYGLGAYRTVVLTDVVLGYPGELLSLHPVGKGLLDGHFILGGELHQDNVDDVQQEQQEGLPQFHSVSVQTVGQHDQVEENENGLTGDDPPIYQGSWWYNQIEDS